MSQRNLWPLGVVGGLATVVIANVIMVIIATKNPQALETKDAWKDGQAYQQVLDERAAAARQQWKVEVAVKEAEVWFRVLDAEGKPVTGLGGQVRATRADTAELDYEVEVRQVDPGLYTAPLKLPRSGLWRLNTELSGAAGKWFDERRIAVEAS